MLVLTSFILCFNTLLTKVNRKINGPGQLHIPSVKCLRVIASNFDEENKFFENDFN